MPDPPQWEWVYYRCESARSDFQNWDFDAVAGHECSLLDGCLLFFYLVEPPKSDAELQVRIHVKDTYDCSRRIELHKNLCVYSSR
jgi:hypothetical protein